MSSGRPDEGVHILILMTCYYHYEFIERTIQSIRQSQGDFTYDICMLENISEHSNTIKSIAKSYRVKSHYICTTNIAGPINVVYLKDKTLNEYDYIAITESDVVLDPLAINEAIHIIQNHKEVRFCSIKLNTPLAKYQPLQAKIRKWVPKATVRNDYEIGPTGFQFIIFEKGFLLNWLREILAKNLISPIAGGSRRFTGLSDSNLIDFCRTRKIIWARTRHHMLDHIGWEACLPHPSSLSSNYLRNKRRNLGKSIRVNMDYDQYRLNKVNRIEWVPTKTYNPTTIQHYLNESVILNQFTNGGPAVQLLEVTIREKFGILPDQAIICVNNGSAALHALGAGIAYLKDKEMNWATQAFTFPPSGQGPFRNASIVDIDDGGGLDLLKLPDSTDGIIVTNIFGNVVDIEKYETWARENDKILLFDNAATSYSYYHGINVSNYGTGATISFHHTKPIGFGEGGAIIVDKAYEHSVRKMINFGIDGNQWHPEASNYKMSDIAAAYILAYLENLEDINNKHIELLQHMNNRLASIDHINLYPNFADTDRSLLSCFCLLFDEYDQMYEDKLRDDGVFCRKYYRPLINAEVTNAFYRKILCVPCTMDMEISDVDDIINKLIYINEEKSIGRS